MNCKLYISTLAILFMASVNAFKISDIFSGFGKDSNSVDVPQKGGNFELEVSANSEFTINLAGNPTTGYQWYLDNEAEVEATTVVLVGQNYAQKKNPQKMIGTGGNFIFNFKVNKVCGQELPKLSFVYKRAWETNAPIATSEITLKANCEKKQQQLIEADGSSDLTVKVDEPFEIKIAGNPTTGYRWNLQNLDEIKASPLIDQLGSNYKAKEHAKGMVGVGGTFIFTFSVNSEACGQELPKLVFGYQRANQAPTRTTSYTLKLDEESCAANNAAADESAATKSIEVNNDEVFKVKLTGNPTTGYSWILENTEELVNSGVIEKVNEDFVEDEHEEGMVGVGGSFVFEFMVTNACGKQLPNLVFGYKRPWESQSVEKVEYTLTLKDDANCAENIDETKEIKVKNNDTFTIEIDGNITTGYKWSLTNEEELAAVGVEKVNEEYIEKKHLFGLLGSGGKFVFTFKINDACGKELPKIKFVHKQPWKEEDQYSEKAEYTIVLKGC